MAERLQDHQLPIRSYFVVWGHDRKPKVKGSHWEVGYTPAHQPNEDLAIAYALQQKLMEIDRIRNDWIQLNLLAATYVADTMERSGEMAAAQFGLNGPEDH